MNRSDKILGDIDLATAKGIEIGACDKPLVPTSTPGIFYVDHADTPTLREKYRTNSHVDIDKLVNVGGVWGKQTLAEACAAVAPVDFIVASHVIEHVPDLIAWLQELASVLRSDGEICLAIPDKRFTFDLPRANTEMADVLHAHLVKARVPPVRAVLDHLLNVAVVDSVSAWTGRTTASNAPKHHDTEAALAVAHDVLQTGAYHDVHCWVFTPKSFGSLMVRLVQSGHLAMACAGFYDTESNDMEFFVRMRLCDDANEAAESWAAMAQKAQELRGPAVPQDALQADAESLRAELKDLKSEHSAHLEHAQQLETRIGELLRSRSWRITAPMRAIWQLFH